MAKHTPGPWHHSCGRYVYAYYQGEFGYLRSRVVASVPGDELDGGEEEQQANGCLIAAAPELLAALNDAVDLVNDFKLTREELNLVDAWLAIISKAEGKS